MSSDSSDSFHEFIGDDNIIAFLSDISLIDFYEKKEGIDLLNLDMIKCLLAELPKKHTITLSKIMRMSDYIEQDYPIISDILKIGNGKISFCGTGLLEIIQSETPSEFDLYIHSCSLEEANSLLQQSLCLIKGVDRCRRRENYLLFFLVDEGENVYRLRLFLEVYLTKEHILRNNYNCIEKCCWDPINGYSATTSSAFSLQLDAIVYAIYMYNEADATSALHSINTNIIGDGEELSNIVYHLGDEFIFSPRIDELPKVMDPLIYSGIEMKPFIPKVIDVRKYLSDNYRYIKVGISDDRYVAFYGCKKLYNIPTEIFRLLCLHWLNQEALIAKERILNTDKETY